MQDPLMAFLQTQFVVLSEAIEPAKSTLSAVAAADSLLRRK
jgi:hypothetical protein